jgi:hypothetical protein
MRLSRTLICAAVCAGAFAVPAVAGTPPAGGSAADPWPAIPNAYSAILATAAFKHNYATVWGYIAPTYQSAVSESRWQACQQRNPVAPPGVKIRSVRVADSRKVPVQLALLGRQNVRDVSLQVLFSRGGTEQAALLDAYWLQNKKGKWVAVWLPAVFAKYKAGGCDVIGPARGLY